MFNRHPDERIILLAAMLQRRRISLDASVSCLQILDAEHGEQEKYLALFRRSPPTRGDITAVRKVA